MLSLPMNLDESSVHLTSGSSLEVNMVKLCNPPLTCPAAPSPLPASPSHRRRQLETPPHSETGPSSTDRESVAAPTPYAAGLVDSRPSDAWPPSPDPLPETLCSPCSGSSVPSARTRWTECRWSWLPPASESQEPAWESWPLVALWPRRSPESHSSSLQSFGPEVSGCPSRTSWTSVAFHTGCSVSNSHVDLLHSSQRREDVGTNPLGEMATVLPLGSKPHPDMLPLREEADSLTPASDAAASWPSKANSPPPSLDGSRWEEASESWPWQDSPGARSWLTPLGLSIRTPLELLLEAADERAEWVSPRAKSTTCSENTCTNLSPESHAKLCNNQEGTSQTGFSILVLDTSSNKTVSESRCTQEVLKGKTSGDWQHKSLPRLTSWSSLVTLTIPTPVSDHSLQPSAVLDMLLSCSLVKTTPSPTAWSCRSMYDSQAATLEWSKAPDCSWYSVFSWSGTGKDFPLQEATSMILWPDHNRIMSTELPRFLKSILFWATSMTAPACSKRPTDKSCGMFSCTTVIFTIPGFPPKTQGTKALNKGLASPPTPLAGWGTSFNLTGLRPFLAKTLINLSKLSRPIRSWEAPGSITAWPSGKARKERLASSARLCKLKKLPLNSDDDEVPKKTKALPWLFSCFSRALLDL